MDDENECERVYFAGSLARISNILYYLVFIHVATKSKKISPIADVNNTMYAMTIFSVKYTLFLSHTFDVETTFTHNTLHNIFHFSIFHSIFFIFFFFCSLLHLCPSISHCYTNFISFTRLFCAPIYPVIRFFSPSFRCHLCVHIMFQKILITIAVNQHCQKAVGVSNVSVHTCITASNNILLKCFQASWQVTNGNSIKNEHRNPSNRKPTTTNFHQSEVSESGKEKSEQKNNNRSL